MPLIDWTPEFKRSTTPEFDRLKLKVGEKARIVCLEKPTFTWVHTLRAPKIVDGRATKSVKKRKDGSEFVDWDLDFIGRPQCLGDHGIIADNSLDPENCPICKRAKESEETSPPERRFAMNVVRYNTKGDGTVISPFGCSIQVWTFTEGMFNKLFSIAQEHGGLVGRDLILGECTPPEAFQKFDVAAGAKNVWETDDRIKQLVVETYQNNKVEDLEGACGRRAEARWLRADLDKITERWAIARGTASAPIKGDEKSQVDSLKGELDNLLAPTAATPSNTSEPSSAMHATPAEPVTDSEKRESTGGSEPDDFSKLLANLNL